MNSNELSKIEQLENIIEQLKEESEVSEEFLVHCIVLSKKLIQIAKEKFHRCFVRKQK